MNTDSKSKKIPLAQNENPYGPSPKAKLVLSQNTNIVHQYPERDPNILKREISNKLAIHTEHIFISSGLVESIDILIRNFIKEGENFIIGEYSFVVYRLFGEIFNRKLKLSKMKDFKIDVDHILSLCGQKTKMIIIDNPNNPTGTIINKKELVRLLDNVSPSILVVIDEAYIEYVNTNNYPDSLKLQEKYPNLIILRTFSKIYGLAALRIGYTIANKTLIKKMRYFQPPFSVNQLALLAASHAINDNIYIKKCFKNNVIGKHKLYDKFKEKGFNAIDSESNFLFIHFNSDYERDKIVNKMQKQNILVRKTDAFGCKQAFRITIGTPRMNKMVMQFLEDV